MVIYFEKANDSISWHFIYQTLDIFNFGQTIKDWIKTFNNDINSCVLQNGLSSKYFKPKRGCRQGDPFSPYSFLLCSEIL